MIIRKLCLEDSEKQKIIDSYVDGEALIEKAERILDAAPRSYKNHYAYITKMAKEDG